MPQQQFVVFNILEASKKVNALIEDGWRVDSESIRVTAGVPLPLPPGSAPDAKRKTIHTFSAILEKP